ncbi:hypothetical protein FKM82_013175 [Ascaphus truei]
MYVRTRRAREHEKGESLTLWLSLSGSDGIIEDVVLLGAPVEGDAKKWEPLTRVVAGRIINGYSRGDWLLSFVYRSSSVKLNVAGLQPVNLDDRRMVNVDLSSVVNGHLDYMKQMDTLLKAVGIKTKECRLEEQSGLLLQPTSGTVQGKSSQVSKDSCAEENANWDWEPVTTNEKLQSLNSQDCASSKQPIATQPAESFQSCNTKCCSLEEAGLPCPDCANNNMDMNEEVDSTITLSSHNIERSSDSSNYSQPQVTERHSDS